MVLSVALIAAFCSKFQTEAGQHWSPSSQNGFSLAPEFCLIDGSYYSSKHIHGGIYDHDVVVHEWHFVDPDDESIHTQNRENKYKNKGKTETLIQNQLLHVLQLLTWATVEKSAQDWYCFCSISMLHSRNLSCLTLFLLFPFLYFIYTLINLFTFPISFLPQYLHRKWHSCLGKVCVGSPHNTAVLYILYGGHSRRHCCRRQDAR